MEEENQFPEINLTPIPSPGIQGPAFPLPLPMQKTKSQQVKDVQKH